MAANKNDKSSDDEFQDAINISDESDENDQITKNDDSKIGNTKADDNDKIVDDVIQKGAELNLNDDGDYKLPDENDESFKDANASDENAENKIVEDDDIDEEGLREIEKDMSEEELENNKKKADELKLEGNELFKNDDAIKAIEVYTEGLKICPMKHTKERAVLYGNRAAAKIKIDSKKSAIADCTKAIEYWPEYVRALLRRAKLYETDDKLDEALEDYKRVYELDPGQREAREAMARLPPLINERNERMKEEMVSKLKDLGNMILKPFGLSTANFQMQQDPNTGSYSINFNQKPPGSS